MWPRSSIPRVTSVLRYMVRRSSRSRPASRISLRLPTGSASRMAIRARTLTIGSGRERRREVAEGGAAQDARRLGRRLPLVRLRAALLRAVGGRAARRLPAMRWRAALTVSVVRHPLRLGLLRGVRVLRRRAPPAGALRHPDSQEPLVTQRIRTIRNR